MNLKSEVFNEDCMEGMKRYPDSYLVEEGEGRVRVDKSEVKDKEIR